MLYLEDGDEKGRNGMYSSYRERRGACAQKAQCLGMFVPQRSRTQNRRRSPGRAGLFRRGQVFCFCFAPPLPMPVVFSIILKGFFFHHK